MPTWTGAISTDWNNALNWVTPAAVPTAATDAIFSGTPVNNCVMGNSRSCRALTFTGYTGTLTVATFGLQVNNNITFQSNQSSIIIGTTGILVCNASGTITSNSGIWPLDFTINNVGATITLADDMRVAGSWLSAGFSTFAGAFTLFIGTNIIATSGVVSPVTNIVMNGSGTYSGSFAYNLEINTTGSITITGSVTFTRRFIITAAGPITMTAANVSIVAGTTVNLGGRTIGTLSFTNSTGTSTISTDIYCSSFIGIAGQVINGPGRIYVNGPYLGNNGGGNVTIELIGSGSFAGGISNNLVINTTSTYTFTSNVSCSASITITHSQGTINPQTFLFQNLVTTLTFNINATGFNLYNWTLPNVGTPQIMTINSSSGNVLNILNILTFVNNNPTFAGNIGWTCGALSCSVTGCIITLQQAITYTTTTSVTMLGTNAQRITMRSNAPTVSYAIWTLQNPATQSMTYVNAQGIDSSLGMTIWSFGGTITTSLPALNWGLGASQGTKAFTFVS